MFGDEPAKLCQYRLQIFKMHTPDETKKLKYPANMGLGQCDLPISVSNVRLTPIPGRWDFRVITLQDSTYTDFTTPPLEHDLYTMEIPADPFPEVTYVRCTSKDQIDQETVCYSKVNVGLQIPLEGVINFNMSTVNSTYESSSAWPNDLGFSLANDTGKDIPCTVIVNGQTVGYAGTFHPFVKCYAFAGGRSRHYAVLQVRGWSSLLATGTSLEIFIPDIKSCTAYDLNCYVTLNSAYTDNLDEPYILNYLKSSVALVVEGSVSNDYAAVASVGVLQDSSLKADFNSEVEICKDTTWTFTFNAPDPITQGVFPSGQPDHILLKFPRNRFRFKRTGATSNKGAVYVIDNYIKDQIYYFIIVSSTIPASPTATFTLGNIRNAIDYMPGIIIRMVYWVNQRRIARLTFPRAKDWLDGGILWPAFDILPKTPWHYANRDKNVDMDFDSEILFMTTFSTCHIIEAGGLVEVEIQEGLVWTSDQCVIWEGVTSAPSGLGFEHECNKVTIDDRDYYHITGFDDIDVLTQITIQFRGKTGDKPVTAPPISIRTYYDAAKRLSFPNDALNINDFFNNVLPAIDITGPKSFPNKLYWKDFVAIELKARLNKRGEFYMHVQYTYAIPDYNTDQNPRLNFQFNTTALSLPAHGIPHCRLDGHLARYCTWAGGTISMSMPLNHGMQANVYHLVMISTRGADWSASTREGIQHNKAGRFQLKAFTTNTGNPDEFTYKVMDIEPIAFTFFWVWSASKVGFDPLEGFSEATLSMYRIHFTNPLFIPRSDSEDPVRLVIEFHRIVWPTFSNGFEQDLGTGLPHRTDLPCVHKGFNLLPQIEKLKCRLFLGSYPNPTKIIITDFHQIPTNSPCQIHIPQVFNPNTTYELVKVGLRAEIIDHLTGQIQPLLENSYDLVNNTFGRKKADGQFNRISVDVDVVNRAKLKDHYAANNPEFDVDTIDTLTWFEISFACKDHQMGGGADSVVFSLPAKWVLPYGDIQCNFPSGAIQCISYPEAHQIIAFLHDEVPQDTLIVGKLRMNTPPYKLLVPDIAPPIKIYVYTRSKLVDIWDIQFEQQMEAVEVTVTVTADQPYYEYLTDYVVTINNLKNIPEGGAIEIKFPSQLQVREGGCRNDIIGGSQLSDTNFECTMYPGNYFIVHGFPKFVGPGTIKIRVRLQNPDDTVTISDKWEYASYFELETPFNKLITYGEDNNPSLSDPTVIEYWDTPYLSRPKALEEQGGTIEAKVQLRIDLVAGDFITFILPVGLEQVRCSQLLCLWDPTPWFDNHNDNWKPAEKCLYDSASREIKVYTPHSTNILIDEIWRIIIDTQNQIDGLRGFVGSPYGLYKLEMRTVEELIEGYQYIPKKEEFVYFECYSLVTNMDLKNMISLKFKPNTPVPVGGYFKLYIPTQNEDHEFLFDDDLRTGIRDTKRINCYARSGFLSNVVLKCSLFHGDRWTGQAVEIKIAGDTNGEWTTQLSTDYVIEIDEIINPKLSGDDKHIEVRFESYDSGDNLLDMSFSYDMTLKTYREIIDADMGDHYTYTTIALDEPVPSVNFVMDQAKTHDVKITSTKELRPDELYDWFVVEFPKPVYANQPHTVQCYKGSTQWPCTVSQGHNWVIIEPQQTLQANPSTNNGKKKEISIKQSDNPTILPLDGVKLRGYAIRDRVVVAIYDYDPIMSFQVRSSGGTAGDFVVEAVDYVESDPAVPAKIPKDSVIKFRAKIKVTTNSPTLPYNSKVVLTLPPNFEAFDLCWNDLAAGSDLSVTEVDNLICGKGAMTGAMGFADLVGQEIVTYQGFDEVRQGEIMVIQFYAKTPPNAVTDPEWHFSVFQDQTYSTTLFAGVTTGQSIQNYIELQEFSWTPKVPKTLRKNGYGPLIFNVNFGVTPDETTELLLTFPASADIQLPADAQLECTITGEGVKHARMSYCVNTGTTPIATIAMALPIEPNFNKDKKYQIEIETRGNSDYKGLFFNAKGIHQIDMSHEGKTSQLHLQVLPEYRFSNPNLRVFNSLQDVLTGFYFSITTTQQIPKNGKIVISFPEKSPDFANTYFSQDLTNDVGSETLDSGDLFKCYSSFALIKQGYVDCRIYRRKGILPRIDLVINNLAGIINSGNEIKFVVDDIKIHYEANGLGIPIEIYSCDNNYNKIESYIFYDWVSPVPTSATLGQTMSIGRNIIQDTIQVSGSNIIITGINTGAGIEPYSYIVFKFTEGMYGLKNAKVGISTTGTCKPGSQLEVIEHYAIYTQADINPVPQCVGVVTIQLDDVTQTTSSAPMDINVQVCHSRACQYVGSVTHQTINSNPPPGLTSPTLDRIFKIPKCNVRVPITVQLNVFIPRDGLFIVWHEIGKFDIDRIEVKNGMKRITLQREVVVASNEMWYKIKLKSKYDPSVDNNIELNVWGQLKDRLMADGTGDPVLMLGFYNRYKGNFITKDANRQEISIYPEFSSPEKDQTGITYGYAKGVNCVIDASNKYDVHIQLPTVTTPASAPTYYRIEILIDGISLATASICSFQWVNPTISPTATQNCAVSPGIVELSGFSSAIFTSQCYFFIDKFAFSSPGMKTVTIVLSGDDGTLINYVPFAVYHSYVFIPSGSAITGFNPYFAHQSNDADVLENLLSLTFNVPGAIAGLYGSTTVFFVDIISTIDASTRTERKILCHINDYPGAQCRFVKAKRLSQITDEIDGYENVLNDRIIITNFGDASSITGGQSVTIKLFYNFLFTSDADDVSQKFFQFGCYRKTDYGNQEEYLFGQNFNVEFTDGGVSAASTQTEDIMNTIQTTQTLNTNYNGHNVDNGDPVFLFLLDGYHMDTHVNDYVNPMAASTMTLKTNPCVFYSYLGIYQCTGQNHNKFQFDSNDFPVPYKTLANAVGFAKIVQADASTKLVVDQVSMIVQNNKNPIDQTLSNCKAQQMNGDLFYIEFELPSGFEAFNPYDCTPGNCPQFIEIASLAIADLKSYEVACGYGSSITLQNIPVPNSPMKESYSANSVFFNGFSKLQSGSPICIYLRIDVAGGGNKNFDIKIKEDTTELASCSLTIKVDATNSDTILSGYVENFFDATIFQDPDDNYQKGSLGYYAFQVGFGITPSLNGQLKIATDTLDLQNFDRTKRLRCAFRNIEKPYKVLYVTQKCIVDKTNKFISVNYNPATAIAATDLVELVIYYEYRSSVYLKLPTTANRNKIMAIYESSAGTIEGVKAFTLKTYETKLKKLKIRSFVDEQDYVGNVLQVSFTSTQSLQVTGMIQIDIPLNFFDNFVNNAYTAVFTKDFDTTIEHGYKIDCLDKLQKLGPDYVCNIFYGLDDRYNPKTYIQVSKILPVAPGPIVINFMQIKNPSQNELSIGFGVTLLDSNGALYEYNYVSKVMYVITTAGGLGGGGVGGNSVVVTPTTTGITTDLTFSCNLDLDMEVKREATALILYTDIFWKDNYFDYQSTLNTVGAQIDPRDHESSFITFPLDIANSAAIAINIINGLRNPLYATNNGNTGFDVFMIVNRLRQDKERANQQLGFSRSNSYAMFSPVEYVSNFRSDPMTILIFKYYLTTKMRQGTVQHIEFDDSYDVSGFGVCEMYTATDDFDITCTRDNTATPKYIDIEVNEKFIEKNQNIEIRLQVETPPDPGPSPNYEFTFYKDSDYLTNNNEYHVEDLTGITIGPYFKLRAGWWPLLVPQVLLQAEETGPLTYTFELKKDLSNHYYRMEIRDHFIDTIFEFPTPNEIYEVRCFWNDLAAFMCHHILADNEIHIYPPSDTVLYEDEIWTIYVSLWRKAKIGAMDFKYLWTPDTDAADLEDVRLTALEDDSSYLFKVEKNVPIQNYRFNTDNDFINFLNIHQATIDTNTILRVRFKLPENLKSALLIDWGRIILKIPTYDDFLTHPQFPDGFGRFLQNNKEIDCHCNECPNYLGTTPDDPHLFKCKVYLGAQHKSAPNEIWIEPQANLFADDIIDLSFPKIKLPPTANTYAKMSLLAFEYDSGTKKFKNISEIVHNFVFKTHDDSVNENLNVAPPSFVPDTVGAPSTVTWTIPNPQGDMQANCHDRFILETEDAAMIFEHPHNPNDGIHYTTATDMEVVVYERAKWIEFRPTALQTQDVSTQALVVQKLKNMPYMIPTGVNYVFKLWVDQGEREVNYYDPKLTAVVHDVFDEAMNLYPDPALIRQPNNYEIIFQPYNKLPMGGKVVIDLPDFDWTFTDSYCSVASGLVDSACDILSIQKQLVLYDWQEAYDPRVDGQINVRFDIINPTTPQASIPITITSYWTVNDGWMIDQETYTSNQVIGGGILRVILWDRFEHPYTICGDRVGPIRLVFNLKRGDLFYPNDYVRLAMWSAFYPPPGYEEIICYFNSPTDFTLYHIKTHRCDWTSANGGSLTVYVPEEIDLLRNVDWELVLTSRGSTQGNGFKVRNPSDIYWVTFTTSSTDDKGWFEANIPGCPFRSSGFDCENVDWEASNRPHLGDPSWSILNFTASTQSNKIPNGDINFAGHSRFLFEFLTHNEIEEAFPLELTNSMTASEDRKELACNGLIKGNTKPLQAQGNSYIQCMNIKAAGNAWNNTPTYVTTYFYEQIAVQQRFHLQLAEFMNGYVPGAFAHIKINMQVRQEDGTYYSQNEHWCWHVPESYYNPPSPTTTQFASLTPTETQVDLNMQVVHYSVALDQDLRIRDVVVYDYSYPYYLPKRGFCKQPNTNWVNDWAETPCVPQPFNLWFVIGNNFVKNAGQTWEVQEHYNFINPPFIYEEGNPKSPVSTYVWRSHKLIYNLTLPMQSPTKGVTYVVMQTTEAENPENQYVKYHVGLFMMTKTEAMTHIRLWAPKEFQDIRNCKMNRGLIKPNLWDITEQIECTITQLPTDPLHPDDGWMIEIDNYAPYKGDGWMIFDFEFLNPVSPTWTSMWRACTYQSRTNLSHKIDDNNVTTGGETWVGKNIRQPNLFRVWRNTISYENRRAQTDDYAEVHLRLLPHFDHPETDENDQTKLEIWLPLAYDIPNGGNKMCQIGHEYHEDFEGQQCEITSDRKIFVNTDRVNGLNPTCSLVRVTTENAIGGNDGVKLPSTPGDETFQIFLNSQDNAGIDRREYAYLTGTAQPQELLADPNFEIQSRIREENERTVVKVRFTAPIDIPAGYDTTTNELDPLKKNPIGYIKVAFNTKDLHQNGKVGFPLNLGQAGSKIKCQAFSQLVKKDGEELDCEVVASSEVSVFYPAYVIVSNFQKVYKDQVVEVHLLDLLNGPDYMNNGRVEVSSYKINADGTQVELLKATEGHIPLYSPISLTAAFTLSSQCPLNTDVTFTPSTVGAFTQLEIRNVFLNLDLQAGDRLALTFPAEFEFRPQQQPISASWQGIQLITTVYPSIRTIHFEFPAGTATQSYLSLYTLKVSQLRHAAYEFTTPYSIDLKVLKQDYRTVQCSITSIPPPVVAKPITQLMELTSKFSGDVYVNYDFQFTPSYFMPAGSTISISLPNRGDLNYNHIASSSPAAVCATSLGLACTISSTSLSITTTGDINEKTPLWVELSGAKNPSFIGNTIAGDYVLSITHPNGFLINEQSFSTFTFFSEKPVGIIYMKLQASNLFKSVSSDYTFTMQNSKEVPPHGLIRLKMPKAWAAIIPNSYQISKVSGSWTQDSLSYTYSIDKVSDASFDLLDIDGDFTWYSKQSITVVMRKLINPSFDETSIFQAITKYDGVELDQTDITDQSLKFSFLEFPQGIAVNQFQTAPQNEGETSLYSFTLQSPSDLPDSGSIQLQFPSLYADDLTSFDKAITCKITLGSNTLTIPCTAENKKLTIPLGVGIPKDTPFELTVNGIVNPNLDPAQDQQFLDILTLDEAGDILAYTNKASEITTTEAPKTMDFTHLSTDSTNLQTKSNYTFCVQTDQPIPLNAEVFVEFPRQFTMRKDSYACETAPGHNSQLLPYPSPSLQCQIENSLRRVKISGHTQPYAGGTPKAQLCYLVRNVENPSESGPSDNFKLSIYDKDNRKTLYQTFGTLAPKTTINYQRSGLVIVVDAISPIARSVSSPPISVTLERAVSYAVTLIPFSDQFNFEPPQLVFKQAAVLQFTIVEKPGVDIETGLKSFSWTKLEDTEVPKFSEMPDSFFEFIDFPEYKAMKLLIYPLVMRNALKAKSLPIKLTLSQPASKQVQLKVTTATQDSFVQFEPPLVVFEPGQTEALLYYTTLEGAISGEIYFELQEPYKHIYYMPNDKVNFEILQTDDKIPQVINYYGQDIGRTHILFRASVDESVNLYYKLTEQGSILPSIDEIQQQITKEPVWTQFGQNFSYQAPVTKDFIYNDVYLWFDGLEEETEYSIFFYVVDLSGNTNGEVLQYDFTTEKKHLPAEFSIQLQGDVDVEELYKAFGLITGLPPERFKVISTPAVYDIPGNKDEEVEKILKQGKTTYTFMILPDPKSGGSSPFEYVKQLEENKSILKQEIPEFQEDYPLMEHSFEFFVYPQEFRQSPLMTDVTDGSVTFTASLKYTGNLYACVLPADAPKPRPKQIKKGLDSYNNKLKKEHRFKIRFEYDSSIPVERQNLVATIEFQLLYDNSYYTAYFVGQNDLPVNPDLMKDIKFVTFKTDREIVVIPKKYVSGHLLGPLMILMVILLI